MSKYHENCTKETPEPQTKDGAGPQLTSKVAKGSNKDLCLENDLGKCQSLLDVLNKDKECICEVAARAVRSTVHMNIGITGKRDNANDGTNPDKNSSSSQHTEHEK